MRENKLNYAPNNKMSLETKLSKTRQFKSRTRQSPPRNHIPAIRYPLQNLHKYIPKNSPRERDKTPDYQ